jgi:hypothetical protein
MRHARGTDVHPTHSFPSLTEEIEMKKTIIATSCLLAIAAFSPLGASAQTTGPAGQDTTKMGTESGMSKGSMTKGVTPNTMNQGTAATGKEQQRQGSGASPSNGATGGMTSGSGTRSGASDGDATGGK